MVDLYLFQRYDIFGFWFIDKVLFVKGLKLL